MNRDEIREYATSLAERLSTPPSLGFEATKVHFDAMCKAETALALWEIAAQLAEANQLALMRLEIELGSRKETGHP